MCFASILIDVLILISLQFATNGGRWTGDRSQGSAGTLMPCPQHLTGTTNRYFGRELVIVRVSMRDIQPYNELLERTSRKLEVL